MSIYISFHAIIFERRTVGSQTNLRENRISREIAIHCHSRNFGIAEKLPMDCVSVYNKAEYILGYFENNYTHN